ncbi:hypothetical protein WJ59_21260 [Burkholderia gladioli]|nr:hypothetical protein WJ59_21260 [Burkholderia gladioli]
MRATINFICSEAQFFELRNCQRKSRFDFFQARISDLGRSFGYSFEEALTERIIFEALSTNLVAIFQ